MQFREGQLDSSVTRP
nr:unnamed protein product [Callosobruchus chinensis]